MKRELFAACTLSVFATGLALGQSNMNDNGNMNNGNMNGNTEMNGNANGNMNEGQYGNNYDNNEYTTNGNMEEMNNSMFGARKGQWQVILNGNGTNDNDFESGSGSVSGQLGYFLTDAVEVGLRQGFGFADSKSGSSWNGRTDVFADYNFDFDRLRPFVGASIGVIYGDDTNDTGIAGPEAGVKYYVKNDTFIYGQAAYQFLFSSDDTDQFSDGVFVYSVGVGFNF